MKTIKLLLSVITVLSLAACGHSYNDSQNSGGVNTSSANSDIVVKSAPPAISDSSSASVDFAPGTPIINLKITFQCSLDGAPFAVCQAPLVIDKLANGPHVLVIRAVDDKGNVISEVQISWIVNIPHICPMLMCKLPPIAVNCIIKPDPLDIYGCQTGCGTVVCPAPTPPHICPLLACPAPASGCTYKTSPPDIYGCPRCGVMLCPPPI